MNANMPALGGGASGAKKVIVFGTFDCLHPGHKYFLKQAGLLGKLFVVLARDVNIKKIKKHKPQQSETTRLENITKLPYVYQAYLGAKNYSQRTKIIKKINPDIICLGYDQPLVKLQNKKIKIIRLTSFKPNKYKSSLIKPKSCQ